ncbi:hypothetical protein [Rhizobium mongolense]
MPMPLAMPGMTTKRHPDPHSFALFLASKAKAGEFDTVFYMALELAGGTINITLFSLNMRDGLKLKCDLRRQPAYPSNA